MFSLWDMEYERRCEGGGGGHDICGIYTILVYICDTTPPSDFDLTKYKSTI